MGIRYSVRCENCSFQFEFDQGSTCWDYEEGQKEMMEQALRGEFGSDFKRKATKNQKGWIYRSDELFYCEKCNEYSNESYYKLYSKKNLWNKRRKLLESKHSCKKCGEQIHYIEGFDGIFCPTHITCPSCRKAAHLRTTLLFD